MNEDTRSTPVLDALAATTAEYGVPRVYGLPGGGTSAFVAALERAGVRFVLAHTEAAAALMASTDAEHSGRPSIVLTSLGPGAAAVVNGLAHCSLDRVPLLVITDRLAEPVNTAGYHQWLDHAQLLGGVVKASFTLDAENAVSTFVEAYRLCASGVPGPVHIDMPGGAASWHTGALLGGMDQEPSEPTRVSDELLARVSAARRPIVLAGLGARRLTPGSLDRFAEGLRAPVLTTYKGKGAVDETGEWSAGILTGGVAERPLLDRADLIVSFGLDSIELLTSMSPLSAHHVDIAGYSAGGGVLASAADELRGDVQALLDQLPAHGASEWAPSEAKGHRAAVDAAFAQTEVTGAGVHPWRTAEILSEKLSAVAEVTVDAGAHMLPISQAWKARAPGRFWISNGLSTMGFALPAAIARSLADPARTVVCCTGDGGLLMALGELASASRLGHRLIIVVFDDQSLSLIRIKQAPSDLGHGVDFDGPRWADVCRGFDVAASEVSDEQALSAAVDVAMQSDRPSLISVRTDATPYGAMLEILRG